MYTAAIETFKPANMATNNRATALHPTPKSMAKRERANREKKTAVTSRKAAPETPTTSKSTTTDM